MAKVKCIGIIAEDVSDVETIKNIIKRTIEKDNMPFKFVTGGGCGKIRSKALGWAKHLKSRGCDLLVLVQDLDRNVHRVLEASLQSSLKDSPFKHQFICIPIEEMEGWFLSDPAGVKKALSLIKEPNVKGNPETLTSPKERLRDFVHLCSNKERVYLNTKHNEVISRIVSIELMNSKCTSFSRLYSYLKTHKY